MSLEWKCDEDDIWRSQHEHAHAGAVQYDDRLDECDSYRQRDECEQTMVAFAGRQELIFNDN